MEEECIEVSESFEAIKQRLEEENEAAARAERRAARIKEKNRRAEEARKSVGFQQEVDDSSHNTTFNAGSDNSLSPTTPRSSLAPKSVLKRKDRGSVGGTQGSSDKSQKVLKTSKLFPASDWQLGMTQQQVCHGHVILMGFLFQNFRWIV